MFREAKILHVIKKAEMTFKVKIINQLTNKSLKSQLKK